MMSPDAGSPPGGPGRPVTDRLDKLEATVEAISRTMIENRKRTAHSINKLSVSVKEKIDENTREMAAVEHELKSEIANTNSRLDKTNEKLDKSNEKLEKNNEILSDMKSMLSKHAFIFYIVGALLTVGGGAWFKSMFDAALTDRNQIENRLEQVEQGPR